MANIVWGNTKASRWVIQLGDSHDRDVLEAEYEQIKQQVTAEEWCFVFIPVKDWFSDLTPWKVPPVWGKQAFGDGAAQTLKILLEEEIPCLEDEYGKQEGRQYILSGYSLAGLFALWAGMETDFFCGIAAVSPSLWYPGWKKYMESHTPKAGAIYLSLGKKEEKVRNQIMKQVGDVVRMQHEQLKKAGIATALEWNEGNHFQDSEKRLAKGIAWVLKQKAL